MSLLEGMCGQGSLVQNVPADLGSAPRQRTLLSRKKRSCYHKLHLKIQNIIMCPRFSTFSTYSIAVFHAILYCDHHNTLPSNMVQYHIYNELNLSSFQSLQEECVLSFVSFFFSWQQKQEHKSTSERLWNIVLFLIMISTSTSALWQILLTWCFICCWLFIKCESHCCFMFYVWFMHPDRIQTRATGEHI